MVDRERVQGGETGHGVDVELFRQAPRTAGSRGMLPVAALLAAQEPQLAVLAARPEVAVRVVEAREQAERLCMLPGFRALRCHRSRPRAPRRTRASREGALRLPRGCRTPALSA